MKGSTVRLVCAALLIAAVIAAPADKPKKNQKKYLYKKQGPVGEPFLPVPLKTKSNSYPSTFSKLPRGERAFPSVVYISDSPDDEAPEQGPSSGGSASSGITDFFDRISRTFGRTGNRETELVNVFPGGNNQDDEAQYDSPSQGQGQGQGHKSPYGKPTAFPAEPMQHHDHPMNDEEGPSAERDDEDSGSEEDEEDQEEDEEEDDVADDLENSAGPGPQSGGRKKQKEKQKQKENEQEQQEAAAASQQIGQDSQEELPTAVQSIKKKNKNKPNKNAPPQEEENQEESEEEEEENDEEEMEDIPENVPPFIRQSIIDAHKKKKQEEAQGQGAQGHGGRPGYGQQPGGQGGYGGRPGYGQGQEQPSGAGGFLSSLLG